MSKGTEEYLLSHGLKNALYTIEASELKEDLFGLLVPCPFQVNNCFYAFNSPFFLMIFHLSKNRMYKVTVQDVQLSETYILG